MALRGAFSRRAMGESGRRSRTWIRGGKRLLQALPADLIHRTLPGAAYLAPIETDVATEPQLVLDTLFRIRSHGEACGVNVAIQGHSDPAMPRRCDESAMSMAPAQASTTSCPCSPSSSGWSSGGRYHRLRT